MFSRVLSTIVMILIVLAVVFSAASLYLVCVSLVAAVVVLNISRQPHAAGLPWPLKHFLTGPCGRALLLSSYIEQVPCLWIGYMELHFPGEETFS